MTTIAVTNRLTNVTIVCISLDDSLMQIVFHAPVTQPIG